MFNSSCSSTDSNSKVLRPYFLLRHLGERDRLAPFPSGGCTYEKKDLISDKLRMKGSNSISREQMNISKLNMIASRNKGFPNLRNISFLFKKQDLF